MSEWRFLKPRRPTEANVVAEFYAACKERGIACYLDYVWQHCRFDAVIIKGGFVVAIVEAKSYLTRKPFISNTKQIVRYKRFGVPVFGLCRIADIPVLVSRIEALLEVRP